MTASDGRPNLGDRVGSFTVTITMEGSAGDGLMRVASVFHRRQIDILQAAYQRVAAVSRMEVVVEATASRVRTAVLTLQNVTGVTACEISGSRSGGHRPGLADQRRAG